MIFSKNAKRRKKEKERQNYEFSKYLNNHVRDVLMNLYQLMLIFKRDW